MISNTIEMLIIVYSNALLQKNVFFPYVNVNMNFNIDLWSFLVAKLMYFLSQILMENVVLFSNARSI